MTIWLSSLIRWRDTGRAARRVAALPLVAFLAFLVVSYPAQARADAPQVIAVHVASAPQVSMVIATPAGQAGEELSPQGLSVTVRGKRVSTTVTPLASSGLSIALVIDTASDVPPDVLEAVQSGATEFLLRLPTGARSAVITAGGDPRVVAPLSAEPAAGVTAISALRPDGARSTAAGAMLAAQELATAQPGPRQIIVFTNGEDTQGPSIEQLTREVTQAQATTYVVQTRPDDSWAGVVDRSGGAVISSSRKQVVGTYGQLAKALEEQYLVSFDARTDLPAVAAVEVNTGETMFRTLVRLPDPATSADAGGQSSAPTAGEQSRFTSVAFVGLALMTLTVGALLFRAAKHRRGSTRAGTLIARRKAAKRQPAARRLTPTVRNRTSNHDASGPRPEHDADPPTEDQQTSRQTPDSVFQPSATNTAAAAPLATLLSQHPTTPTAPPVSNKQQPADTAPNTPTTPSGAEEAVVKLDPPTQQQ